MAHGCFYPHVSCTAFLAQPASLWRWAPLGDLGAGMRMCAMLPQLLQHSGDLTPALVATHVPPSKPGVTRFFARYDSLERGVLIRFGAVLLLAWRGEGAIPPCCLRRAFATPKLPPRKTSAVIFGCGRVSPHEGCPPPHGTNSIHGGIGFFTPMVFDASSAAGIQAVQEKSDVRRSV